MTTTDFTMNATACFIKRECERLCKRYEGRSFHSMGAYDCTQYYIDKGRYDELVALTKVIRGASLDEIVIDVPDFPDIY